MEKRIKNIDYLNPKQLFTVSKIDEMICHFISF